jgi:hypothetical protein
MAGSVCINRQLLLHAHANEFNLDEKPRPYWWHFA